MPPRNEPSGLNHLNPTNFSFGWIFTMEMRQLLFASNVMFGTQGMGSFRVAHISMGKARRLSMRMLCD